MTNESMPQPRDSTEPPQELSPEYKATLQKLLDSINAQKASADAYVEALQSSVFSGALKEFGTQFPDRAAAYVNRVLTIGYASFFAVWWLTREQIEPVLNLSIGICLVLSVGLFIGNECFNVIAFNRIPARMPKTPSTKSKPEEVVEFLGALSDTLSALNKAKTIRPWLLNTSIVLEGIGALILVGSLMHSLWMLYVDP
jgi:hypothetical protein